jgi:hypothetical protein
MRVLVFGVQDAKVARRPSAGVPPWASPDTNSYEPLELAIVLREDDEAP